MKTFFKVTSIIVFSIFCFTSCENEPLSEDINLDNSGQPETGEILVDEIIGDWQIEDYTVTTTNTLTVQGMEIVNVAVSEFASGDQIITFSEDNQYSTQGQITVDITTSVDGTAVSQTSETVDTFGSGSWSIDGDQLILTDEVTGEFSVSLITLNAQTLEFFLTLDNESLGIPEDDPLYGEVTGEGTVIYTKL